MHENREISHQSDIGAVLTELLNCFAAIRGLRHQVHVRLGGENRGQPVSEHRVVIDGEDPNCIGAALNTDSATQKLSGNLGCNTATRGLRAADKTPKSEDRPICNTASFTANSSSRCCQFARPC
jgi:hypothetical protein